MRSARTILSDVGPRAKSVGYRPEGEGGYTVEVKDANGLVVLDAVYDPETNSLEPLSVFASYVGFQHWWKEGLRSTWTYGFVNVRNLEIQTPDSLHRTHRVTSNLVWSPILRIDLVLEYLAGTRKNKDGESGFSNQLQVGGTFRF